MFNPSVLAVLANHTLRGASTLSAALHGFGLEAVCGDGDREGTPGKVRGVGDCDLPGTMIEGAPSSSAQHLAVRGSAKAGVGCLECLYRQIVSAQVHCI